MSRLPRALVAGALGTCVCSAATLASAALSLTTEVSARKVEVGTRFTVQLRAMGDGNDPPSDPQLKLPEGVTASPPRVSQQSSINIVNGQMTQSLGISATWSVIAMRAGKLKLGPASVQTPNGRKNDQPFSIEVVPQGTLPPPPLAGQPLDPFDLLRGMGGPGFPGFPGFPGMSDEPEQEVLPPLPDEYRIDRALDPVAFLRDRAEPRRVVVGEQVTLSTYAYAGRGNFEVGMSTEPTRDDFLAYNLSEEPRKLTGYLFDLNGQRWITVKISEYALFPLKTGKLRAGGLSFGFVGRGYSSDPKGLVRSAEPVQIEVVEPPLAGRPAGYRIGDVGRYTLKAEVSPREVPAGGSISVVTKLEGSGNLPASLLVPERSGVHFLEPQIVEQIGPKRGLVQGFRTFTYVVELSQPGEQDLGEISLPYWDPKTRAYAVARAALGVVKVTGSAKPAAPTAQAGGGGHHLRGLVTPPPSLRPTSTRTATYFPSRPGYWLLVLGLPVATWLGFVLSDLAKLLAKRARERRGSLAAALDEAETQLAATARSGNVAATAGAAERALFVAIEKGTQLKARGILKSQLAQTLAETSVPPDLSQATARLLDRCDQLRFAGVAEDLSSFAAEVQKTCEALAVRRAPLEAKAT